VSRDFLILSRAVLMACIFAISACSSVVRTDVQTFRDENASFSTGTIRVATESDEAPETLEFRYYKDKLEQRLSSLGYTPTEDENAQFIAKLGYSVSRQEKDKPHSRVLIGGQFGYGYGYPYSRGSVLLSDGGGAEFEYVRELSLAINQPEAAKKDSNVIQIKAVSVGNCEHLTVVYDEMLDAIFANFMRSDGSIERIAIKDAEVACP